MGSENKLEMMNKTLTCWKLTIEMLEIEHATKENCWNLKCGNL